MSVDINRIVLDVRPYLKNKQDPFQVIMDNVKKISKEDVFELHATFKPTPLLSVMRVKGFLNKVEKVDDEHWIVTFVHKSNAALLEDGENQATESSQPADEAVPSEGKVYQLDNRGLEPPQPMIRTMGQLDKMSPGDKLIITNDRVPVFLLEELNGLGYRYEIENLEGETARVAIYK